MLPSGRSLSTKQSCWQARELKPPRTVCRKGLCARNRRNCLRADMSSLLARSSANLCASVRARVQRAARARRRAIT